MPTSTLSGYRLINNGPLTTTFTAPASCSTEYQPFLAFSTNPSAIQWAAQCQWLPPADCLPYGSAVRSQYSSAQGSNPKDGNYVPYHSPGLICPSGWATVGGAKRPNPTSTSVSGAFELSEAVPTGKSDRFFEPFLDVLLDGLGPSETVVVCCPSSYTASSVGCFSTVPSFTPTMGCQRAYAQDAMDTESGTWIVGGQTITGERIMVTGTQAVSVTTTSFSTAEATEFVGVASRGMIILIHQATDIPGDSTDSKDPPPTATTASTASKTSTSPKPSKTSAAAQAKGENKLGIAAAVSFMAVALAALMA